MTKISAQTSITLPLTDTTAVYLALADNQGTPSGKKINVKDLETAAVKVQDLGTSGGNVNVNFGTGEIRKKIALNANTTFTFSGGVEGGEYILSIRTNGYTITWPSNIAFFGNDPTFASDTVYQPVKIYYQG